MGVRGYHQLVCAGLNESAAARRPAVTGGVSEQKILSNKFKVSAE